MLWGAIRCILAQLRQNLRVCRCFAASSCDGQLHAAAWQVLAQAAQLQDQPGPAAGCPSHLDVAAGAGALHLRCRYALNGAQTPCAGQLRLDVLLLQQRVCLLVGGTARLWTGYHCGLGRAGLSCCLVYICLLAICAWLSAAVWLLFCSRALHGQPHGRQEVQVVLSVYG